MNFITSKITLCAFFFASFTVTFNSHSNTFDLTKIKSTQNLVKAGNKYITLLGDQVNVGEQAPPFKIVDQNFAPVTLADFQGQTLLISVVPSLDTGVCSIQTKRFNEEAAKLPKNITILTISNDLPFAQKRFCDVENTDNIKVLSDSVWRDFGTRYGLLIKDMGLLTRAIFVIDNQGKIVYKELVANISKHPNYDKALVNVKQTSSVIVDTEATKEQPVKETEKE